MASIATRTAAAFEPQTNWDKIRFLGLHDPTVKKVLSCGYDSYQETLEALVLILSDEKKKMTETLLDHARRCGGL